MIGSRVLIESVTTKAKLDLGGHLQLAKSSQNDTQSNKIEDFGQKEQFYGYIYAPSVPLSTIAIRAIQNRNRFKQCLLAKLPIHEKIKREKINLHKYCRKNVMLVFHSI